MGLRVLDRVSQLIETRRQDRAVELYDKLEAAKKELTELDDAIDEADHNDSEAIKLKLAKVHAQLEKFHVGKKGNDKAGVVIGTTGSLTSKLSDEVRVEEDARIIHDATQTSMASGKDHELNDLKRVLSEVHRELDDTKEKLDAVVGLMDEGNKRNKKLMEAVGVATGVQLVLFVLLLI
mmetsp:Transcript_15769/g.26930  ORF Transcript_15769/g.26930 Transcript_15769/m.26930 type:complete len:179 (+) Transcript_15769:122-658(+)|eukprot:CAMPEP_0183728048 /NCGR_PEP_ID=MMETSP0737-20130205/27096_1 /TAXON_ID=385413 /ORGANISM="Thalassiosira miniscula, Strain CCMP1093" /LENGTH=178 /DNA_ID=CAMNT_0025959875 /DNA_START=57 /DNA_END=593 /DNA_ORIENTATION=+